MDDPGFLDLLTLLVVSFTTSHAPEQVWLIQIDNWFDHKWLRFSGNVAFPMGVPLQRYGSVKLPFWRDKLTFPPFNPNRVISQTSYVRRGNDYVEAALPQLPHKTKRQNSGANLNRRIESVIGTGCFIWYSGNTVTNGKGSVMLYDVQPDNTDCWFVALSREARSWTVSATKGADRHYIESLIVAEP